jgi:hypothetical protein
MWTPSAAAALAYRETGLLAAGLVGAAPTHEGIRSGAYADAVVDAASEALVLWVDLYGLYPGDREVFTITAPDGTVLLDETNDVPGPKAEWRSWAGHRKPAYGWPRGTYEATYLLRRGEHTIVEVTRTVAIQ